MHWDCTFFFSGGGGGGPATIVCWTTIPLNQLDVLFLWVTSSSICIVFPVVCTEEEDEKAWLQKIDAP